MKRFLVTILSCVYFIASSGMLLRQHYCMGDLVETQIDFGQLTATNTCGDCGMEESEESCCQSKTKLIKKVQDQHVSEFQLLQPLDLVAFFLPDFFVPVQRNQVISDVASLQALQKPPPKSIALFVKICCFRI